MGVPVLQGSEEDGACLAGRVGLYVDGRAGRKEYCLAGGGSAFRNLSVAERVIPKQNCTSKGLQILAPPGCIPPGGRTTEVSLQLAVSLRMVGDIS